MRFEKSGPKAGTSRSIPGMTPQFEGSLAEVPVSFEFLILITSKTNITGLHAARQMQVQKNLAHDNMTPTAALTEVAFDAMRQANSVPPDQKGECGLTTFKAIRIDKADKGTTAALTQFDDADLMEGDVTVAVEWSTVNFKDGLAVTGKAPVVRRFPMIAGVDFAGRVIESSHPEWRAGDKVICTGWGLGETHLGAYAERARVKGDWLVRLPDGLTGRDAMAIGTAGFTAMLSVLALEKHGLTPKDGPVVVTGAAGGVGSVAISLLSKLGFHVVASTGRVSEADYLRSLGATEIIDRNELSGTAKPLAKERWAGGVDSVGSTTLANLLSMTKYHGAIAACGLAAGMDLPSSVAPFILRGVCLLGIDSVMCPLPLRKTAWARLASGLDKTKLSEITHEINLGQVIDNGSKILSGQIRGRLVVKIA